MELFGYGVHIGTRTKSRPSIAMVNRHAPGNPNEFIQTDSQLVFQFAHNHHITKEIPLVGTFVGSALLAIAISVLSHL